MPKKLTLKDMQDLAKSRGGKCLSKKYTNNTTKLKWQCSKGHTWFSAPINVKNGGTWCPVCGGTKKLSIKIVNAYAKKKGGKCLSKEYVNSDTPVRLQCALGHIWESKPKSFMNQDQWCPYCGKTRKKTIKDAQELAKEKGGICLSKRYVNANNHLKWRCAKGHEWKAGYGSVRYKSWCPYCAGTAKHSLQDIKEKAKSFGGKCISKEYLGGRTKLQFVCKLGHHFNSAPRDVFVDRWCPICSQSKSERICRKMFEIIFQNKFPKTKPDWLRNKAGNKLELDGYCEKLNLAFEYQGSQHYNESRFFNRLRSLNDIRNSDNIKVKECRKRNIVLIHIPYNVKYENLAQYIIAKCKKNKIKVPNLKSNLLEQIKDAYSPEYLKEIQSIAKGKGGKCASKTYSGATTKLDFECDQGHKWRATPNKIKYGMTWCPVCSHRIVSEKLKGNIKDILRICEKKKGKCTSKKYINGHTKMSFVCAKGHKWRTTPESIRSGRWCPYCSRNVPYSLGDIKRIASKSGIKCLSKTYKNQYTKLRFKCKKGHEWKTTPKSIITGHGCPYCAGNNKKTIKDMQALAKKMGGKCLSKRYINCETKLKWQCSKGHIWDALYTPIQSRGVWCPECSRKKISETRRKNKR